MTESDGTDGAPFWRRKRPEEMTNTEWESLCDRCGRCCLILLKADDDPEVYPSDLGCVLLDTATGQCSDYANRKSIVPGCIKIIPGNASTLPALPSSCGYIRVHNRQDLDWWHPLVSGNPESVRAAGVSVVGRFVELRSAGVMAYHTVDWPSQPVTSDPSGNWQKAMHGGVNASVPTPFGPDSRVDLDLMAGHCFWLLSNGCHGLAVLDKAGEVASLAIAERIAILEGLQSRGVPVSKLLAGIGAASPADGARIATRAYELGIRGVMLNVSIPSKVLPPDVIPENIQALIAGIPERLHLYLSFSVAAAATAACMTALEAFMAGAPGRLKGIRDEAQGCHLGMAALENFGGYPFEVYTADEAMLGAMTSRGGAGLIGPGANLLGLHCAAIMKGAKPEHTVLIQRAIEAVAGVLRSRPAVPAVKTLLARHTGRPEWGRLRLPLRPFGTSERAALFQSFDACGVSLRPADPAV